MPGSPLKRRRRELAAAGYSLWEVRDAAYAEVYPVPDHSAVLRAVEWSFTGDCDACGQAVEVVLVGDLRDDPPQLCRPCVLGSLDVQLPRNEYAAAKGRRQRERWEARNRKRQAAIAALEAA